MTTQSRNKREGKYIIGGTHTHNHHDVAFSRILKGRQPRVPTRYGSFVRGTK